MIRRLLAAAALLSALLVPASVPVAGHTYSCGGDLGTGAMVILYENDTFGGATAKKCSGDFDFSDGFGTSSGDWNNRAESVTLKGDGENRYICFYTSSSYAGTLYAYRVLAGEDRHLNIPGDFNSMRNVTAANYNAGACF